MNITLLSSQTENLSLSKSDESIEDMIFSVNTAFSTDDSDNFIVIFYIKLRINDEYILEVRYISYFKADAEIKEEDRVSPFFSINAPAIAYPFLRAYISNLMLNSGFEPIMLPTINFVTLAKNKLEGQPEKS